MNLKRAGNWHRGAALWAVLLSGVLSWTGTSAQSTAQATFTPAPTTAAWPSLGLNLGHRTAWGAEQLMANVLRNPGLESGLDGALLIVGSSIGGLVSDDNAYLNRPEGFWVGATFTVLTGADAGLEGVVRDSHPTPGTPTGPTRFLLDPNPAKLAAGDVISLRGNQASPAAPLWWTQGLVRPSPGSGRPGTPGHQALRLDASSLSEAALLHHLDGITRRAGKLLPVRGPWVFSIWSRKVGGDARVQVKFRRHGSAAWLDHSWHPGRDWKETRLSFEPNDSGPEGAVELSITVRGGAVDLDDAYLGEAHPGPGGFRRATVDAIKKLRPGYLREWQGQLGDGVTNRLAPEQARRPSRYRPGENDWFFHYGLSEFAELAAAVEARPWFILPPVTSPTQAEVFGEALHSLWRKHRFDELVVEFGNENWNPMFRASGIQDPGQLARATTAAFKALRKGAGPEVPLHFTVGTQFVRPEVATPLHAGATPPHSLAVAPYFAYRMTRDQNETDVLREAMNEPDSRFSDWLRQLPTRVGLSVYEVNAHTTMGDASQEQRARWVDSPGVAIALARRLLQAARHGVTRQAVYKLSGFDTPVDQPPGGMVQLFGLTRELGPPARLRPSGQVLAELNAMDWSRTADAPCHGPACSRLVGRFFAADRQLAIVSGHETAVQVRWPCASPQPGKWRVRWLSASTGSRSDHAWQEVDLVCEGGQVRWTLPPWTLMLGKAT